MSINIQLGDPIEGSSKTFKTLLTSGIPNYKIIGRTSKDYLTNKIITDPSNNVTANSLLVNGSPLKINNLGTVGQVLTMNNDGSAGFSNVSGAYASASDVTTAVAQHAALSNTHNVDGNIVGTSGVQTLTNKNIEIQDNNVSLNGIHIDNIISQNNPLLYNSNPRFATLGINKIPELANLDITGSVSTDQDTRCIRCQAINAKITLNSTPGKEYDLISKVDGSFNISSVYDSSNRFNIDSTGKVTITSYDIAAGSANAALVVNGGIGIGKTSYFGGNIVLESSGELLLNNSSNSTGSSTGSLKTAGGIYTAGANYFDNNLVNTGILTVYNTTNSTNQNNGSLIVTGGVGVARDVNIGGDVTLNNLYVTSDTNTNNLSSGALTIAGGVGIAKDVNIGGNMSVNNIQGNNINCNIINNSGQLVSSNTNDAISYGNASISTQGGMYIDKSLIVNTTTYYRTLKSISLGPTVTVYEPAKVQCYVEPGSTSTAGVIIVRVLTSINLPMSDYQIANVHITINLPLTAILLTPRDALSASKILYAGQVDSTNWILGTTSVFTTGYYYYSYSLLA